MTAYYDIETKLQELLIADIGITTVTRGSIDKVALQKSNMYGLAHITTNNATANGNVLVFNLSVYIMDVVDISKGDVTDLFIGNDNEMDVLNTTLAIGIRVMQQFRQGDVSELGFQLQGQPTLEPFVERFEDHVAGWAITFNVMVPHGMTTC
tara:strand:- start:1428 stop:1883 length:456 start_codon:yes stop_codon:yes gene_type:complete